MLGASPQPSDHTGACTSRVHCGVSSEHLPMSRGHCLHSKPVDCSWKDMALVVGAGEGLLQLPLLSSPLLTAHALEDSVWGWVGAAHLF